MKTVEDLGEEWRKRCVVVGANMPMGARPFIWLCGSIMMPSVRDRRNARGHHPPANENFGESA